MWPQNEVVEEVSAPPTVTAPEATVGEFETEVEMAEQAAPKSKSVPAVPDMQTTPESEAVAEQTTLPLRNQETTEPPPGNMVHVPGFGWVQNEGPNHVEYAEDMYENGNKIGIMG